MTEKKAETVGTSPRTSRPSSADWADEEASTRTGGLDTVSMPGPVQPPQAPRAQLTVISGPHTGRAHLLLDGETVLGRGKEAHVVLDDAGASRMHARIVLTEDGRYLLEDLKSRNGTFANGKRVEGVKELASGDRIHVGPNVTLSFAIVDAQAERITHQLYESSMRDPLTRAHNRRYLVDSLGREISYARRHAAALSVLMFDIDHFKRINDTLGHLAGDEVLRELSALVMRMMRQEDVFARYGGEEFVMVARGVEHTGAGRFAERLRTHIERLEVPAEATIIRVTVSVGYASLAELGEGQRSVEGLLRLADSRLYTAKSRGRNRVCGE